MKNLDKPEEILKNMTPEEKQKIIREAYAALIAAVPGQIKQLTTEPDRAFAIFGNNSHGHALVLGKCDPNMVLTALDDSCTMGAISQKFKLAEVGEEIMKQQLKEQLFAKFPMPPPAYSV